MDSQGHRRGNPHRDQQFPGRGSKVFDDEYALAMWSQREFLVLGPKFANAFVSAENEIDLCLRFGHEPTTKEREALINRGVESFVTDLAVTAHREWDDYGEVAFKTDSPWVPKNGSVSFSPMTTSLLTGQHSTSRETSRPGVP